MSTYRAVIALDYSSVGRGGECYYADWSHCCWSPEDQVMEAGHFQSKTNKFSPMPYCRDKDDWKMDVPLLLAISLIVDPNSEDAEQDRYAMFPTVRKLRPENCSTWVSEKMKYARKMCKDKEKQDEIPFNVVSHMSRFGSFWDLQDNIDLPGLASIIRGGWTFQGDCTSLHYGNDRLFSLKAARASAGHKNTDQKVNSPSLLKVLEDMDDPTEKKKFFSFCRELMERLPFSHEEGEQLYTLKFVLLGAVFEKYEEILNDIRQWKGDDKYKDVLQLTVEAMLNKHHIAISDFRSWCSKVCIF